jgi:hypothetical protein
MLPVGDTRVAAGGGRTELIALSALINGKLSAFLESVTAVPVPFKVDSICAGVKLGFASSSKAAIPAAVGDACDVPR